MRWVCVCARALVWPICFFFSLWCVCRVPVLAAPLPAATQNVLVAAYHAADAAVRMLRPGVKNTEVTAVIKAVAEAYGVTAVQGTMSHQMKQYVTSVFSCECVGGGASVGSASTALCACLWTQGAPPPPPPGLARVGTCMHENSGDVASVAGCRFVIDGNKIIHQRVEPEQKVEECTFEPHEVYAIDICFTTGDGKVGPRIAPC
jgi:hypothetical protein